MKLPRFLPNIPGIEKADTEDALLRLIIANPKTAQIFFESACQDSMWSEAHPQLMTNLLDWFTQQSLIDKLSVNEREQLAGTIHEHFLLTEPWVKGNIVLKFKDGKLDVNALLLRAASEWFHPLLELCVTNKNPTISLSLKNQHSFVPLLEFIKVGDIPSLWMKEKDELLHILDEAAFYAIIPVMERSQQMLKKYITRENCLELLFLSHHKGYAILKNDSIEFINQLQWGIVLTAPSLEKLIVEFTDFTERTVEHFQTVKAIVTDCICSGALPEDAMFSKVFWGCPNLSGLDLSSTICFTPYFEGIPSEILILKLSKCPWLAPEYLKKIAKICPNLEELDLSNNRQLNFNDWGMLLWFTRLSRLDLSECHQIKDEDVKVVANACKKLTHLSLAHCHNIDEQGYFDLARILTDLQVLILSNCKITDAALTELGVRLRSLHSIDLTNASGFTSKGLKSLAAQLPRLEIKT